MDMSLDLTPAQHALFLALLQQHVPNVPVWA